ncbi:MAG: helix-turn-helix domain-containing protein [Jatrophihabitantaceae bacterium]
MNATIGALAEVGYARTSLGEICRRSGVSRGGLFRHFDSRLDLLVSAAEEVGRRHLQIAAAQLAALDRPTVRALLLLLRERDRAPENAVWFELLVAARTDSDLRERLAPIARSFVDQTVGSARAHPLLTSLNEGELELIVTTLEHVFDGESTRRQLVPDLRLEERRLELLA